MTWRSSLVIAALTVLGVAPSARASDLYGTMGITGSVLVGPGTINWFPFDDAASGTALVLPPTSGYFSDPGNAGGAVYEDFPIFVDTQDLNTFATPVGVDVSVTNFLSGFTSTNTEYSDLTFELTRIVSPTSVLGACIDNHVYADGESCTLGAFLLTQEADSVSVQMNVLGIFRDPSLGLTSLLASGTYTTQDLQTSGGQILGTINDVGDYLSGGGNVSATYSATFVVPQNAAVPEPASLVLFGTGAALLGGLRRRRAKNAKK